MSNISKSKNKSFDEDIPHCVCGKPFITKLVSECYNGTGVGCDECGKNLPLKDKVYHCPADKNNILHTNGYDLCIPCYNKKSEEINTDNILFQIWFIINCLNKDLYHILSSKYQINSRKSLISKPTYEIFQMLTSIHWNQFNDGTCMKLFCDTYDKLKENHLSIKNTSYKFKSYPNQNQNQLNSINKSGAWGPSVQNTQQQSHSWCFGGGGSFDSSGGGGGGNWNNYNNNNNSSYNNRSVQYDGLHSLQQCTNESMNLMDNNKNIGFSVGGGPKDINSAKLNIENHEIPHISALSFQGIFNEYYFDTRPLNTNEQKSMDLEQKNEAQLPLFYPSYTCSKGLMSKALSMIQKQTDMLENDIDFISQQEEYFLTVGLNSNIKEKDFKRKKLNLCVVLDISGSMSCGFGLNFGWGNSSSDVKTKMRVANECLLLLLTHLNSDDRFGLVLFNNYSQVQIPMDLMKNMKMEQIEKILNISASGGTNFEVGYKEGTKMYENITSDTQYENRLVFLTDAHPNAGRTDSQSLLGLVSAAANKKNNKIYTTFIGIGVDFNSKLISKIIDVRGANQFSVHTNKEFKKKLYDEFDYFCSPMVFNLRLTLFCEGTKEGAIEAVYGSDNSDVLNGEVMKIKTLFPSPPNNSGQVKGGIILIKLKKQNILNKFPYFCEVTFEDKFGNIMKNKQKIFFNNPNFGSNVFYANLGVRKGILLVQYILLMQDWVKNGLMNPMKYKKVFNEFKGYFQNEIKYLNDNTLSQEIKILDKLINW